LTRNLICGCRIALEPATGQKTMSLWETGLALKSYQKKLFTWLRPPYKIAIT